MSSMVRCMIWSKTNSSARDLEPSLWWGTLEVWVGLGLEPLTNHEFWQCWLNSPTKFQNPLVFFPLPRSLCQFHSLLTPITTQAAQDECKFWQRASQLSLTMLTTNSTASTRLPATAPWRICRGSALPAIAERSSRKLEPSFAVPRCAMCWTRADRSFLLAASPRMTPRSPST